jgi:hypothetical protein
MIRFDYLHDAPPGFIDALRAFRLPRKYHDVAAALCAVGVMCVVAESIERGRVSTAVHALSAAQARFDRSRAALQRLRVQSRELDALLNEDRALRNARLSGPLTAQRLAAIGNVFPQNATLDAMQATPDGYDVKGRAESLQTFGTLLARLDGASGLSRPALLRVTKDAGLLGALAFEIGTGQRP